MTWRPIETAPKDGTPFIAITKSDEWPFWHSAAVLYIQVAPEDEDDVNDIYQGGQGCTREGRLAGEYYGYFCKFLMDMDGYARYSLPITEYTHWMPLPAPPEAP